MNVAHGRETVAGIIRMWLVATAMIAVWLPGPVHAAEAPTRQQCIDEMRKSPMAAQSCNVLSASVKGTNCVIEHVFCSVPAVLDGNPVKWKPSFDSASQSLSDTAALDLCFAEDSTATHGYAVTLKAGCDATEIASASMRGRTMTTTPTTTTADCTDKWEDAPAYSYCSSATAAWSAATEECTVSGSCSIKVWVDDSQTTFTPSAGNSQSVDDTADLDICFTNNTSTITATVRPGCNTGEVTSGNAYHDQPSATLLWTSDIDSDPDNDGNDSNDSNDNTSSTACTDKWEDAPAYSYCSSAAATWSAATEECTVSGSCSIKVWVDDEEATFTPSASNSQSVDDTADLDICFTNNTSTITATVRPGCNTGEVTSGNAYYDQSFPTHLWTSDSTTTTPPPTTSTACTDKWEDAPAYSYCSSAAVTWSATTEECTVSGSCSIKVWVDDSQTTFTPSAGNSQSVDDTADLDICFTNNTSTITATVRPGCNTGEVTSGNAYYDQSSATLLWTSGS